MLPEFVKKPTVYIWEETILPLVRWSFWDKRMSGGPGSEKVFGAFEYLFKLAKVDYLLNRLPEFDPKRTETSWIPINRKIDGLDEIALHEEILFRFIEKAEHRVIVNWCGCRAACKCEKHDHEIGCLMMGESALLIPEKARKEVGVDEAKAHVRKAVANGLVPITGKIRIDNDIFMIPDKGKLLTICFCCSCCCITRFSRHLPVDRIDAMIKPIEGLTIEVNADDCVGCGKCAQQCYVDAIDIVDEKCVISNKCRICGRCVAACPTHAIVLKAAIPNPSELVFNRIDPLIDY